MNWPNQALELTAGRRMPADNVTTDHRPQTCLGFTRRSAACSPKMDSLMPHKHPEDRVYTVIFGVFYIGLGDEFDASKLEAYPPGAVIILPGNTPHFR
jgi:hypothetical protein